jgi:hypothetical protein
MKNLLQVKCIRIEYHKHHILLLLRNLVLMRLEDLLKVWLKRFVMEVKND